MMIRFCLALLCSTPIVSADPWSEAFEIEWVTTPAGIDPQVGGIDVLEDGRVAVCYHRGEVMIHDPATGGWTRFADGLQEPLGLLAENPSSLVIMQRAELTRIRDTDGDGVGDEFETLTDDFGMSGNYHEFAFGPARGGDGSYYIGLNVASHLAGIRKEIRGEWQPIGLEREVMELSGAEWAEHRGKAGRMFSRVPYRGWVMKVDPDNGEVTPFACGFRSPNGIGFDADGRLLVTDNQGDWRGTSPLYHVEEGGFYGHPASLVWRPGWDRDPLTVSIAELEALRTPAIGLFPQGELANSPTQPIAIPEGVFGPFAGQTLIGEMNQPNLIRFLPDPVGGVTQGSLIPFLRTDELGIGNNRLAFAPDGTLWIGKTHLTWAGAEGLARVKLKDPEPFAVEQVKLEKEGFRIRFTAEVAPDSLKDISVSKHRYLYSKRYGSPKLDRDDLDVRDPDLSEDGRELMLGLDGLAEGFLHTIFLPSLKSRDGKPLLGDIAYYQANRLR